MKLCKDCRFMKPDPILSILNLWRGEDRWRFGRCTSPNTIQETNLITGNPNTFPYASVEREFECGKEAKNFEPRKR